jgi:methyl-accepting chemotaxis protein
VAKDIKGLITASTEQVTGGVRLVGETGDLLEKIVARVGQINGLISGITRQTESQSVNLVQVNTAVAEMDRMTQRNAAMVEQSTAASRSLADEANNLTKLVNQFRIGGAGARLSVIAPIPVPASFAPVAMPVSQGNLALKADLALEEDWTEF